MVRSSLASTPLADLQRQAKDAIGDKATKPAKAWLDDARHFLSLAEAAERSGNREEALLNYSKLLLCYNNVISHKGYAEAKQDQRFQLVVHDMRASYNHYVEKVQALKKELRERPFEQNANGSLPSSPPKTDTTSMGSIADRMRALQGKGMSVDSQSKRVSRDLGSSQASTSVPTPTVTGGAGNYGVARPSGYMQAQQAPRVDTMMPPPPVPEASSSRTNGSNNPVKPASTGSSYHSTRSEYSSHEQDSRTRENSYKSNPPTPILTPHLTAGSSHSRPPSPPTASSSSTFPNPHSPASAEPSQPPQPMPKPSQYASPPIVGQHHNNLYHRMSPSLPSFPNPPGDSEKLPDPQKSQADLPNPELLPAEEEDDLASFASAFPSLSEFGKQFGDSPGSGLAGGSEEALPKSQQTGGSSRSHPTIDEDDVSSSPAFPSVPSSLPSLPSAPTFRPSSRPAGARELPQPPSRPAGDPPSRAQASDYAPAPPNSGPPRRMFLPDGRMDPDVEREERERFARLGIPYSPLNFDNPNSRPTDVSNQDKPDEADGHKDVPLVDGPSPPLVFPTPRPMPSPAPIGQPSRPDPRLQTKLPMSNAVEPSMLRHYLMDDSIDVLLLDARSYQEFENGFVGDQTLKGQAGNNQTIWVDPTVLWREGLNSSKLEDALSLSPPEQQKAFMERQKYDLVVFYDQSSRTVPTKGQFPTAISVLFRVLYENEYSKTLKRSPVLLTGGYVAWKQMLKDKEARRAGQVQGQASSSRPYNPKTMANGASSNVIGARPPVNGSKPLDITTKRQNRDSSVYQQAPAYAKNIADSFTTYQPQSMTGERSYTGHHLASPPPRSHAASAPLRHPNGSSSSLSSYAPQSSYGSPTAVAPPPQASINPGPMARRRSDYVEQHNQAYSGYSSSQPPTSRASIDYPQAYPLTKIPQPPPAAASHALERHDARGQMPRSQSIMSLDAMSVLPNGEDMKYWNDIALGLSGLKNLGNTCYMNSTLQCLSATFPFARFFLDGRYKRSINMYNPLGTKGNLANAFAELITALWQESYAFLSPITFRKSITTYAPQFSGTDQHDSQEFLSFVLDGLHEDLNRIQHKPPPVEMTPEREHALETLPPEVASEKEWKIYKMRNDSLIVDLFQGQYRNRLECLTCHKTSTTYDAFMYLALPVPMGKSKVVLQQLIDEFVKVEIMEGPEAWNCPRCKVPRRTSKTLTISRLPPVLLIQLKRFSTQNGVFWDKSETPVIFPVKGLDLTRYLPASLPVARNGHNGPELEDPRTQIGPFRYDLYGVSNHMGSLSSGHYTAFVNSSKGWMFCEDSKITRANERDVVSRPAYLLFYKRVRA